MTLRGRWPLLTLPILLVAGLADAEPSAFTYNGRLLSNGKPANGLYDFRFDLYDAMTNGGLVAATEVDGAVPVSNGAFTAALDFGTFAWNGSLRWLEIGV